MKNESKKFEISVDYIINGVSHRGWVDSQERFDDFSSLRKDERYRNEIIASLYEQYFLPARHEFEWAILVEIVNEIITSAPIEFAAVSIAGGVIGNAAYDLLKSMCNVVAEKFKKSQAKGYSERANGFLLIASDVNKIEDYFNQNSSARIEDIEQETGVPREKIYPIIKLAGFRHHRRGTPCFWEIP